MKPSILILYYSQSGQLSQILRQITSGWDKKARLDFVAVEPESPFPWPWNAYAFFDAMPETVERIAIPVKPLPSFVHEHKYDLILLGYQPWFLNPSQPVTGLMSSEDARLFSSVPVVTVVGCRNMWLYGQEQIKRDLKKVGATLVGNIVLEDTHPNLVSLLTIIRWAFTGRKEGSRRLPEAGVSQHDIEQAARFGPTILQSLIQQQLPDLQKKLLEQNAVKLKPGLILLEQRGIRNFRFWAKFIREKGGPGDVRRRGRVLLFKRLLLTAIFVLSPISSLTAFAQLQLRKKKLVKDLDYFRGIELEDNRI